jgi:hypothetical protein
MDVFIWYKVGIKILFLGKNHTMKTNRRSFLKTMAAGIAATSLPDLSAHPGLLKLNIPAREGTSVMGLTCEPLKTVRIGMVGLGMRGMDSLQRLLKVDGVEITAVCDIMHAECAYIHDLRWLKFNKKDGYWNMWRLQYSKWHTGNLYPTHGLGPVAQIMKINRGDRMEYLTSMSSNQVGMSLYAREKFGADSPEARQNYRLGDMNTTLVQTFDGKTIMIQHDTTSPRSYSRIHLLSGTKGIAQKWPRQQVALEPNAHQWLKKEDFDTLMAQYEHPISREIGEKAKQVGGHGGMDFIMDYRLIYCLRNGLPLDQDVYDAATWSSIVELSEISVKNHSSAVEVPDFTRGAWETGKPWG